jgi:hypothetical protein
VGFFGTYLYDGSRWTAHQPDQPPTVAEPWLVVDIYDSDITTLLYRPAGPGSGLAYLGDTPRTYFEDAGASAPTDVVREAAGLGFWWAQLRGGASDAERRTKEAELAAYLAEDRDPAEIDLDDEEDDELDDADVFVEVKTARFLAAIDLPLPDDLARRSG